MRRNDNGIVGLGPLIIAALIFVGGCVATIAVPKIHEARQRAEIQRQVDEYMAAREAERKNVTPRPTPAPTTNPATYKIPVVGMAEENINKTQYSRTFRFDHDFTSYENGHLVTKRYYYDGRGTRSDPAYYIVICADGYVDQVMDQRYDPVTYMPEGGLKYKRKSSSSGKSDPYGDAEEFYYQNQDEFADFDEAEEYYNDHYGK